MISKENINKLEAVLQKEKEKLELEIGEMPGADMGNDTDHGEEEADETEQEFNNAGIRSSLKARLNDINLALDKVGTDAYGVCEDCGQEISLELLKVDPESRLCRDCKKKE